MKTSFFKCSEGDIKNGFFEEIEKTGFKPKKVNTAFSLFLELAPFPDWYFNPIESDCGAFGLRYHMIDLFQYFFKDVAFEHVPFGNRYNLPYEDNAFAILRSNKSSSTDDFMLDIYLSVIKEHLRSLWWRVTQRKIKPLECSYFKELNHFFECGKKNVEPVICPKEALRMLRVIEEGCNISWGGKI